ncbi:Proline iminopeptidase [Slackia heliotrinireducens]|uniref:Proline iminopeptidase n=1 Tax=Slackia heliotrinireducens (strain ATCC 29202 / DSM 20476 / NCTC 11029 / RHS 1) TaxID=471855 RepID=C7N5I5_SLAHD|nr:proline iminopeptidase-family hydrolase [Slackia heliotrinireducens]ACV22170.1 proline-specific peptidase [Slackia heliotrinireducens DSM 20476]VEH00242.1 Proline iminopeptidase [Slackia heliotrinireducens]
MAFQTEGYIDFAGFKTYYRIFGEQKSNGKLPLVMLHGGPGFCHNYLLTYAYMADRYDRQIIFYDQLGCGRSAIPHQEDDFYSTDLWLEEFYVVREALGLDECHTFGSSWGGMLEMLIATHDDEGIHSMVINSSPVRIQTWLDEAKRLINYLPEHMQRAIQTAEATGDYDTPEAQEAIAEYYKRHVVGTYPPFPEFHAQSEAGMGECYLVMQGPSEFVCPGKLRDWDMREACRRIKVPCLAMSGTDDEGTPLTIKEGVDCIPGCEWVLIPNAVHEAHLLHPDLCMRTVEEFISRHE